MIEGECLDLLPLPLLDRFDQLLVIVPGLVQFRRGGIPLLRDLVPGILDGGDSLRVILVDSLDLFLMVEPHLLQPLLMALLRLRQLLRERLAFTIGCRRATG